MTGFPGPMGTAAPGTISSASTPKVTTAWPCGQEQPKSSVPVMKEIGSLGTGVMMFFIMCPENPQKALRAEEERNTGESTLLH